MNVKDINLKNFTPNKIRNFSVIAHIDHGKSTLSDRLLEATGTLSTRHKNEQFLDKLKVEKERGITVKAQTVSMFYNYNNETYLLNLIDTPGHVDFSYEVSRSLYACQGALLLVDAAQGVQAQTMANFYLAFEQELSIIPVINKVDLPNANVELVSDEINQLTSLPQEEVIQASAKSGIGIDSILENIVKRMPAPTGNVNDDFKALLFDSWFDPYKGVICLIALENGKLQKNDKITLAQSQKDYEILELGLINPGQTPVNTLYAGQVGYIVAGIKSVREARVGDTIHHTKKPVTIFGGFKPSKPMVFAEVYPVDSEEFENLADAIEKLILNDASVKIEKKSSVALGLGFRCGFLGLLHMDVFKERLENEYNLSIIITSPSVLYKVDLKSGKTINIETPSDFPDPQTIENIYEPMINANIMLPEKYLGNIIKLLHDKRGRQKDIEYLKGDRVILKYQLPLNEVATNFYDKLKSLSSGYASLDYEESGYEESDLVKLDILLNSKPIDALSTIVHRSKSYNVGRELALKLKKVIPRQLFQIAIQAAIGAKIIARESVSQLRKNVIAKCYGGDITRKRKLLEKQKEGKKKMKNVGSIEIPQEAFLTILKDEN